MKRHEADQLYTFADVARLLKVDVDRLRVMRNTGQILGPDYMIPGGGRKAARWSATRVQEIQHGWSTRLEAM